MLLLACAAAYAQNTGRTFEVASVKVFHDLCGGHVAGGPGSPDPARFTFRASMGLLLRLAFNVNSYQLSTPGGLPDDFVDIDAKLPPHTSKSEFEEMLRNLLIERFAMRFHRETHDIKGYELLVGKGGLRLKTPEITATPPAPDILVGSLPLVKDRSGERQLPPGREAHLVIRLSDGRFRHSGRMQSMSAIVEMCARELGQPVVDRTGLTGIYDFNVDFMRMPDDPVEQKNDLEVPFVTAFESQLGLHLKPAKVPVSVVVIDHVEKTPTEN